MFDSIMRQGGAPALMSGMGEKAVASYKPPDREAFPLDVIVGRQDGGEFADTVLGEMVKVTHLSVKATADQLTAKGINGLQRNAIVTINGSPWPVELSKSSWGQVWVILGLMRRETTNRNEMQVSNGTV